MGLGRFELPTSRLSSARSNQLSYKPASQVSAIGNQGSDRNRAASGHAFEHLIPEYRSLVWARSRRKRNEDGGVLPVDLTGLSRSALMFPRDPIKTREASLKDHP